MELLESYEFTGRSGGQSKYDFDKLFDGSIYRLQRGDDFDGKTSVKSIRGYLATQASKRGKSLRTQIEADGAALVVQAAPKPASKPQRRTRAAKKKS